MLNLRKLSALFTCLLVIVILASSALAANLWSGIDDPYGVKAVLNMNDPDNQPRTVTGAPYADIPNGAVVVALDYISAGQSAVTFIYNGEYYFIGITALTPSLNEDGTPVRDPRFVRDTPSQPEISVPEELSPGTPELPVTPTPPANTNDPQATLNLAPTHGYRPRLSDGAGEPVDIIPDGATVTVTRVEECEDGTTVTYFTYEGQEYWLESEFVNLVED